MPKIIKDATIINDNWIVINDTDIAHAQALPAGDLILPLIVYQKLKAELSHRKIAVWLNSDEAPEALAGAEKSLDLIAINFPAFADGRGYSYAHVLREQLSYDGELRAIGDVLRDQLFYMKRVGFNSFAMRKDQKLEEALANLSDFSKPYQAAVDRKTPLFTER